MKDHVAKSKAVFDFEREGNCIVCRAALLPDEGIYAICPNTGCEGVGHVTCWSKHLLSPDSSDEVVPVSGECPSCGGRVKWGDMMKELSLRLRGQKEMEKLLKKPRKRKAASTPVKAKGAGKKRGKKAIGIEGDGD